MAQTWQPNAGDDYYDIPQILKRLDWLDAERRKDKDAIYLLQEQITQLKAENLALKNDIKELQKADILRKFGNGRNLLRAILIIHSNTDIIAEGELYYGTNLAAKCWR